MSKIGFIQDLIRGIRKTLDAGKTEAEGSSMQATAEAKMNVKSLLTRANIFLEDKDFGNAGE
jgi:hypothetical protein